MQKENQADPTQRTADQLLTEIHKEATEAVEVYSAVREYVSLSIERLETIAQRIERSVKRMEILKQTMKPLPPIVEPNDNRLCLGELAIIRNLADEGPAEDVAELATRTQYAQSSIRTWLPMLRVKGLVMERKLELTACGILTSRLKFATPPEIELVKQAPGRPEEELCPS